MKITFMDKRKMKYVKVSGVLQIQHCPHYRGHEWVCKMPGGQKDHYKCSQFDIERIETEEIEGVR